MNSWLTFVASVIASTLGGGAISVLVKGLLRRPVTKVEGADRLSDAALDVADRVKAYAEGAIREAERCQQEVLEVRRELGSVRREAEALSWTLRRIRIEAFRPDATIERLQSILGGSEGANGVAASGY